MIHKLGVYVNMSVSKCVGTFNGLHVHVRISFCAGVAHEPIYLCLCDVSRDTRTYE